MNSVIKCCSLIINQNLNYKLLILPKAFQADLFSLAIIWIGIDKNDPFRIKKS